MLNDTDYLMQLLDILPYRMCWLDSNNNYLWCNEHYAKSQSRATGEIIGNKIDSILPLNHIKQILNLITHAEKSRQQVQNVITVNHEAHEYQSVKIIPVFDREEIEFVCIEEDISYDKYVELTLRQQVEDLKKEAKDAKFFLQRIIDYIPAYIFWKDKNGIHLGDNIYHAKLAGFDSTAEVCGKSDAELWGDSIADQLAKNDQEVMQSKETMVFEEINETTPGERVYYLNSKSPLLDADDKVIGTIGIALDITERKKMEMELTEAKNIAEASNRSKSEFISNMSHDIRTPISSLVILSSILVEKSENSENQELAQDCNSCATQLLHLINQILEVAELDHRIASNKIEVFQMKELLHNIVELTGPSAKIKKLSLQTHYDDRIPKYLNGHKQAIYRVLLNLVSNAIKFTETGSVEIYTSLSEHKGSSVTIDISVKDTGIGIPEDKQRTIFQKFSRLSRSDRSQYKGFGIGLYIVDELVKSIEGKVVVASNPGDGSTFTVSCPLEIVSKQQLESISA